MLTGFLGPRWGLLMAVTLAMAVQSVAGGMAFPLFSLLAEGDGVATGYIGLNAATPFVAGMLVAPLAPRLIARLGLVRLILLAGLAGAGGYAIFACAPPFWAWFPLRFLLGGAIFLCWLVTETWVNALAGPGQRGRAVALYSLMWALGIAAGPQILLFTGTRGSAPFIVAVGLMLAATLPILWAAPRLPRQAGGAAGGAMLLGLALAAPLPMLAGFSAGYLETSLSSLWPVYLSDIGMSSDRMVMLLTLVAVGGMLAQLPIGAAADLMSPRRLLIWCVVFGLAGVLAMPALIKAGWAGWTLLLLWGGFGVSYYTIGLVMIGHRFHAAGLAAANTVYLGCYNVGSVAGPALGGWAMQLWPAQGLTFSLALMMGVLLVVALARPEPAPQPA